MPSKKQRRRTYYYNIIVVCLLLLIGQAVVYLLVTQKGMRLFASDTDSITLMRLQTIQAKGEEFIIMGSSQTERFISTPECTIIGVPGSSFLAAWQHFVKGNNFPQSAILILEGNLCLNNTNEALIKSTEDFFYRLFAGNPNFSQAARPSNMLLSIIVDKMLPKKELGSFAEEGIVHQHGQAPSMQSILTSSLAKQTPDLEEKIKIRIQAIKEMKQAGFHPCFVFYPNRYTRQSDKEREEARLQVALYIADQAEIPLLNYKNTKLADQINFSDSSHMRSTHPNTEKLRNTILRDAQKALEAGSRNSFSA